MRQYTIFLRPFGPSKTFGGILPQTASGTGGQFSGDDRGFSVDADPATTSRVNLQFSVDVAKGVLNGTGLCRDPSFGPYAAGARGGDRGKPAARLTSFQDGTHFRVTGGYTGANPLVPFAPAIGAQREYCVRQNASGNMLSLQTKTSGHQLPACETVDDGLGHTILWVGFAPDSKAQIFRLYGQLNQPAGIYFESQVTISLSCARDVSLGQRCLGRSDFSRPRPAPFRNSSSRLESSRHERNRIAVSRAPSREQPMGMLDVGCLVLRRQRSRLARVLSLTPDRSELTL
jgi:hypothetical protein